MRFTNDFVWGAATAAYQVEGAVNEGGRGPSVWDAFCKKPGAIRDGHSGEIACDHYHRLHEDVRLMREIGLKAYRFSFSWPRILPSGTGRVNSEGIAFYDQLLDALLDSGIQPYATLFHWDYPHELYLQGGWLNPKSVDWFEEYATLLVDRFSDRIENWFTLNEPQCFLGLGHVTGLHAPGLKLDWPDFFLATKHALLSHGRAVQVIRSRAKRKPMVSFAPISHNAIPVEETSECIEAARRYAFGVQSPDRTFWASRFYLDPVLKGEWPEESVAVLTKDGPRVTAEELRQMNQPIDALGLNFYSAPYVRAGKDGNPEVVNVSPGAPQSAFSWLVTPEGIYWAVRHHYEQYGLPIFITENGLSSLDWVSEDGKVHDPQRIDYTSRHLKALSRAIGDGIPINGYFHWSVMDNFEWAEGYRHRFGLIHVDFQTQNRTIKDSGHWYRKVIESNGSVLFATPEVNGRAKVMPGTRS